MKKSTSLLFNFFLFALTAFTLVDFVAIGFTNSDDSDCFIRALEGNYADGAAVWAKDQGRFFFYYRTIIAYFPYIIDNFIWTKTIQYLPVIGSFVLAAVIIGKLFKYKVLGYGTYLFFLLFLSVTPSKFVPPLAYPFLFSADIFLFLLSALFLMKYYAEKKYVYFLLSVVSFFIPFYGFEAYFVCLIVYLGIIIYKSNPQLKINGFFRSKSLKETLPPLILASLFYVIYFVFRANHLSNYSGNQFASDFSLTNLFSFIFKVNSEVFPNYIYFKILPIFDIQNNGIVAHFSFILKNSSFSSYAIALFTAILSCYLFLKIDFKAISKKRILTVIGVAVFLAYSINILPGLTQKYNISGNETESYVTTFFAFYGITIALFLMAVFILKIVKNKKIYFISFLSFVVVFLFFTSLFINYSNKTLSWEWQKSQERFFLLDEALKANVFQEIPEETYLLAPVLFHNPAKLGDDITANSFSWRKYIRAKSGKSFYVFESEEVISKFREENRKDKNTEILLLRLHPTNQQLELVPHFSK